VLPKSRITFALVSVLVVGLMVACGSDERNGVRTKTGASGDDNQASAGPAGQWQVLAKAEEGWYRPEGIFWDDDRLLVVAASTIMAWDPENDSWQVLARIPQADECEGCGYSETAVWTGEELLLWGGGFSYKTPTAAYAGAAFNPKMSKLRPLPDAPIPSRWWHTAVWSGAEMIVWGGSDGRHERRDGAAYNPRTDSWRRIADAPMGGYAHSVVWTGEEMIVWGGSDDYESEGTRGFPRSFLNVGAAYDPGSDTWRTLEPSPLDPRGWHSAVWTGEEMIVWGGVSASNNGAYDPDTDSWREISHGPLSGRVEHSAVWTGEEMIVWGGSVVGGGPGYEDGAAYDPVQNFWAELPPAPIASRFRHAAIWNGVAMIVWGGQRVGGGGAGSFSDGASFRP
jgi:N-acetylneuraminic acid mutarotase